MLEDAIERVRALPEADQDLAAELLLSVVYRNDPDLRLTPEQVEEVRRTRDGLRDGTVRLLSEEETEEMWRRLGA